MYKFDIITQGNKATSIAIASTATVYTAHFDMFFNNMENPSYAFEYRATSEGNVALKIELEQSNTEPTTKYAYDPLWCVPDDAIEFNNSLTDELYHIKAYPPTPTKYGRFKITGLTGNDATTALDILTMTIMR